MRAFVSYTERATGRIGDHLPHDRLYWGRYSTAVTPSAQHIGVTPFPYKILGNGVTPPLHHFLPMLRICVIYKAEQNVCVINPQDSSVNPFAAGRLEEWRGRRGGREIEEEEWTRRKRARDGCALRMIEAAHESLGDTPKIRLFSRGSGGQAPRS